MAWPKPMIFSLRSSMPSMPFSASSGSLNFSIMAIAASLAPPCSGPRRLPMAPVTQLWISLSVDAQTRAVKVDALNSCSAYRISDTFITVSCNWLGFSPRSMCRKWAPMESSSVSVSTRTPSWLNRYQ